MSDLTGIFHDRFEVLTQDSQDVMDQAFKLRYQVYCMETGFEDRAAFADRRERDAFDTHAAHGVIRDRISGTSLATVRLVMPDSQHGCSQFPIEQQYPTLLDENGIDDSVLPRASTGEISRFAISKRSRQQITELAGQELATRTLSPRFTCPKRRRLYGRRSPLVTFGLFLALVRLSAANDITHWVAIMEPSLLRLLGQFGIHFTPIGGVVEYHGLRQPCYGEVEEVLDGIQAAQPDLWHLITDHGMAEAAELMTAPTPLAVQAGAQRAAVRVLQ